MNVEIPPHVRDAATRLGAGVPYALKVAAGQLEEDPNLGEPSALPGVLTVTIDGEMFEDCPALDIGYILEPDRIEIRHVTQASSTETTPEAQDDPADPVADAVSEREIADAWQRITRWLQDNAPDSHAALRPGASPTALAAVEHDLGIRIPAELRTLWLLTAGDDGVNRAGCLPGNQALMPLDAVAAFYHQQLQSQATYQDALNAGRPEWDRITVWEAAWIPVVSHNATDRTSGLYLDTATGYLGRWSRYNEGPDLELDTLVTYLENVADMLEAPSLATQDKPGLVGGALVWGSRLDPAQEDRWQPLSI